LPKGTDRKKAFLAALQFPSKEVVKKQFKRKFHPAEETKWN